MKHFFILTLLLHLTSCSTKIEQTSQKISPLEKKIYTAIERTQEGESTGPISIEKRKLRIEEIAEHLDMDIETAKMHLKATNVHGYYSLNTRNLPPEGEFILYHVKFDRTVTPTKTFFVNGNGILVTKLDQTYVDLPNNFLFFSNYLPGEPADFVLISKDGKYIAVTRIVPNPIELIDTQKHHVSVEISSPNKRQYTVHCSGLKPFESYMLITRFENEKFMHGIEANAKGEAFLQTGPNTPWITGGDGSIELRGEGIHTPLHLKFQWGA